VHPLVLSHLDSQSEHFQSRFSPPKSVGRGRENMALIRICGSTSMDVRPGDKAIIFPDGRIWGWIGGGCAQPVVIKEALKARADGRPRLVRISPASAPENGIVDYTMTCHSGGMVDIYIEPVLPKPHILIIGRSPIAQALARIGKAVHYRVSVAATGADSEQFPEVDALLPDLDLRQVKITPETFIVVSTQGEGDEEALEQVAKTDAAYVAWPLLPAKSKPGKFSTICEHRESRLKE
jgi:xanthine/CO dehydrogenase XdhC/CoxF family maturation factor